MPAFISHSFKDEAVYTAICLAVDAAGIRRWDPATMSPGESLADQLHDAIRECEVCVFIATRRSIESPWCLAELGAFWGASKRVLLFMADPDLSDPMLPPQFKGNLRVNTAQELIKALTGAAAEHAAALAQAKAAEGLHDRGIQVTRDRHAVMIEFIERCRSAKTIRVLGVGLPQLRAHLVTLRAISADANIIIAQFDHESDQFGSIIRWFNPTATEQFVESVRGDVRLLEDELREHNVTMARYRTWPSCSIMQADDVLFYSPYMYGRRGADSPVFRVIRNDSFLFDEYIRLFELIIGSSRAATGKTVL